MQNETSSDYKPSNYCFCGGELASFKYAVSYKVCSKCNTFISQEPPPDSLVEFYGLKEYWYDHQREIGHPNIESRVHNDILDGRVFFILDFISKNCYNIESILEIGCAPGLLLALLSKTGHNCYGIEPHPDTAKYLTDKFGVKVYSGVYPQYTIEVKSGFDLIMALDVVEHSYEPVEFFLTTNKLLGDQGWFLLQTPIYKPEEWRAEPWGKQFPTLFRKWEHIHLFSEKGIIWLSERCGFKVIMQDRWAIGHDILLLQKRERVFN